MASAITRTTKTLHFDDGIERDRQRLRLVKFGEGGICMKPDQLSKPSFETSSEAFLERFLPGTSPSIKSLRKLIMRLNSPRNTSLVRVVLVLGESGAGKNYLARVLAGHRRWLEVCNSRSENPGLDVGLDAFLDYFEEIYLPVIPDTLIESVLFGYVKGAFTDARENRPGLFGGPGNPGREPKDILLDEIGDATESLQSKLLQVIEEGRFRPVGGGMDDYYDASGRLIMATNRNLSALVKDGIFREDLLWRLREFVVVVPPLREQHENIEAITRKIEMDLRRRIPSGLEGGISLAVEDINWAKGYEWPGNIRELRHAIVRWIFEEGDVSLKEIVKRLHQESIEGKGDDASVIAGLLRVRLESTLHRGVRSPESLSNLVKEFERMVKGAIYDWYRTVRPTAEQLGLLFPGNKLDSVRNKIGSWGKI